MTPPPDREALLVMMRNAMSREACPRTDHRSCHADGNDCACVRSTAAILAALEAAGLRVVPAVATDAAKKLIAPYEARARRAEDERDAAIAERDALRETLRAIELNVDTLNTKGYPQKKATQGVLDRIKAHCRDALSRAKGAAS